jgi:hypothetical protein
MEESDWSEFTTTVQYYINIPVKDGMYVQCMSHTMIAGTLDFAGRTEGKYCFICFSDAIVR